MSQEHRQQLSCLQHPSTEIFPSKNISQIEKKIIIIIAEEKLFAISS